MSRAATKQKQRKMFDERDRKEALKKGVTVKKLREDRLKSNREKGLAAASFLPVGGLAVRGVTGGSKLFGAAKKFLQGAKKTKPAATKLSKTTKTTKTSVPPTKTSKTTKTRSKTKVAPTTTRKTKTTTTKVNRPLAGQNKVRDNIIKGGLVTATGASLSSLLPKKSGSKPKVTKAKVDKPKMKPDGIKPKAKQNIVKSPPIKRTNITAGGNVGFGPKGNIFASSEKRRKELMEKYGGTGSAAARAAMKGTQGNMVSRAAGGLRPVPEGNKGKGLSKLPTEVRNKMGFMRKGGKVMKMRGGGAATRGIKFNRGY
jgi:hypothetical protein